MISKLQTIFPNALFFTIPPKDSFAAYYIFFDQAKKEWVGIPKVDLNERELNILKTIYELIEMPSPEVSPLSKSWYEFLFFTGDPPSYKEPTIRILQFHINGIGVERSEIESALEGFFSKEIQIIWENEQNGVIIENQKLSPLSEKELISMRDTFESDFYINISFYIGKKHPFSTLLPKSFQEEREYFNFAQNHMSQINMFTFEKVFPYYLAFYLPETISNILHQALSDVFEEDPEIYSTLKVFLENNSNVSLTAKKLYIHRNTLQYRLDKFTEKTGIQLKDFYGAFTVFLSCLIFEKDNLK